MSYYVVVDVRIDDPEQYQQYMAGAKPLAEEYGGEYLVRGGDFKVYEGDYYEPRRIVIGRFPSREAFESFYYSDAYQALRAIRTPASDMVMVGVEGFE